MDKVTAKYESIVIFSTKQGEEGIKALVEKFSELISQNATLDGVDEWGKRRLAYPINYETEGHYVMFTFTSSAEFPAELDRVYHITDGVVRSLIVKQ